MHAVVRHMCLFLFFFRVPKMSGNRVKVGAGPLAADGPVNPCSCMKRILSPRSAFGRLGSKIWFSITVEPCDIRGFSCWASTKARSKSLGWSPKLQATHPLDSSSRTTESKPGSKFCKRPWPESLFTSTGSLFILCMRSISALLGRRCNRLYRLGRNSLGGVQPPRCKVSRTVSMTTTEPVSSCDWTSSSPHQRNQSQMTSIWQALISYGKKQTWSNLMKHEAICIHLHK